MKADGSQKSCFDRNIHLPQKRPGEFLWKLTVSLPHCIVVLWNEVILSVKNLQF